MKKVLGRLGHAARVVVHDPKVDRAGLSLAGIIGIRLLLALGASDALVQLASQVVSAAQK